jgi:hypothetical protein
VLRLTRSGRAPRCGPLARCGSWQGPSSHRRRPVHRTTPRSAPRRPSPSTGRRSVRGSRMARWQAAASRLRWSKVARRRHSTYLPTTGARAATASPSGSRAVDRRNTRSCTACSWSGRTLPDTALALTGSPERIALPLGDAGQRTGQEGAGNGPQAETEENRRSPPARRARAGRQARQGDPRAPGSCAAARAARSRAPQAAMTQGTATGAGPSASARALVLTTIIESTADGP